MTNVLPFPTNPVRHALSIPAFRRLSHRVDVVAARPTRAGVDRIADTLLALEAACWAEPCILPQRGPAGGRFIAVVLPGHDGRLTPSEARDVAAALRADNAFAGALGVAVRLDQVADEAERHDNRTPLNRTPLNRTPRGSGGRTLIAILLLASALLALRAFA